MNRVLLAIIAATVSAGVAYATFIGTAMLRTAGVVAPIWMLVFVGMLWGAAFALAILFPLWLLMRRSMNTPWLSFGLPAITLWAAISTGLFASYGLSAFEAIGNAATALPAGIAAVVAFILAIRRKPYA